MYDWPFNKANRGILIRVFGGGAKPMEEANENSIQSKIPECPVCFKNFSARSQVYQCSDGHFVCGVCRPRVRTCPTCRGRMIGRCHGFEEFLQGL